MLGDLISGGMKLLGGFLGQNKQEKAAQELQDRSERVQKEFAQNAIQWKVEDAKKAGIHPLYAMGASTTSFSPISVGTGTPLADSLGSMGQDIGRAVNAVLPGKDRESAFQKSVQALTVQKLGLENELLASRIRTINQAGSPPPMPVPGDTGPVPEEDKFKKRPKLILGGENIATDPGTSNMQDYSDRYGDEGLPAWLIPPLIMWQDAKANVGRPTPGFGRPGIRQGSMLDRLLQRYDPRQ